MKPRWLVALMLLTIPIWFVPGLIYIGWKLEGRDFITKIPKAVRYAFFGRRFGK
ncbi:hypothetical protein [Novosphingobium sp. ST904]|uniref:hypothetical protein n=1 Tax=Novosphingobium sp. ST904 TaxID=1684385 RepID=UPI000B1C9590|nr:hypothetical protein [Novosphingobium sp. ST904]TCM25145.1 hypothetical protein EDF59_1447 [Novosphingobium sp. ST904]